MRTLFLLVYLTSVVGLFTDCKQIPDNIFVYLNDDKVIDYSLVFDDGKLTYDELNGLDKSYVAVTLVFNNKQKIDFTYVPRVEFLESDTIVFQLRDTAIQCTRIIKSNNGALRIIGNRTEYDYSCEQYNDLILQNE